MREREKSNSNDYVIDVYVCVAISNEIYAENSIYSSFSSSELRHQRYSLMSVWIFFLSLIMVRFANIFCWTFFFVYFIYSFVFVVVIGSC